MPSPPDARTLLLRDAVMAQLATIAAGTVAYAGHDGYHLTLTADAVVKRAHLSTNLPTLPCVMVLVPEQVEDMASWGEVTEDFDVTFLMRMVARGEHADDDLYRLAADIRNCLNKPTGPGQILGLDWADKIGTGFFMLVKAPDEFATADLRWAHYEVAITCHRPRGQA